MTIISVWSDEEHPEEAAARGGAERGVSRVVGGSLRPGTAGVTLGTPAERSRSSEPGPAGPDFVLRLTRPAGVSCLPGAPSVELLAGDVAQLERRFAQRQSSRCALLGDLRRLLVADVGVSAVTSISERRGARRSRSRRARCRARSAPRSSRRHRPAAATDSSTSCSITGLNTLSWKLPCEPAKATAASLPKTCTHDHASAPRPASG